MDPTTYDWTRFDLVYYYNAPIERVFRAWSTAAGLTSFFIQEASFTGPAGPRSPTACVQPGDTYVWRWRQPYESSGQVTALERNDLLAFTFGDMQVRLRFAHVAPHTEVHLEQFDIADTDAGRVQGHLNCRSCWIFFMTNLTSVLDHGVDLRMADPARVSSMEVGFVPQGRAE